VLDYCFAHQLPNLAKYNSLLLYRQAQDHFALFAFVKRQTTSNKLATNSNLQVDYQ
jgi:hypothetical protein